MSTSDPLQEVAREAAREYARLCKIRVNFTTRLGSGQDGFVWPTSRKTALKALNREEGYYREVTCYKRFAENKVLSLHGFSIPKLIGYDDSLHVIEMGIVTAPFILDFAKAWVDTPPDYSPEVLAEWESNSQELFDERWPIVKSLIYSLRRFGIYYYDAKPANIMFAD